MMMTSHCTKHRWYIQHIHLYIQYIAPQTKQKPCNSQGTTVIAADKTEATQLPKGRVCR